MKESEQRDRFLVDEMLRHAEVLASVVRRGKDSLTTEPTDRYAAEHAVELFAEAAKKLSKPFRTANPKIPWDALRRFRRDVAHPYDKGESAVQVDQLWEFASVDAPRLSRYLRSAKFADPDPRVVLRRE